jgi:hypothetical protein
VAYFYAGLAKSSTCSPQAEELQRRSAAIPTHRRNIASLYNQQIEIGLAFELIANI